MTLPGLPENPPLWHGGTTNDPSWSAAAWNAWWLLRLLVACFEALVGDVWAHPWLLAALPAGYLAWRWAPAWWWRLSTVEVVWLLLVWPDAAWKAGLASGAGVGSCLVLEAALWIRRVRPALPAGRE